MANAGACGELSVSWAQDMFSFLLAQHSELACEIFYFLRVLPSQPVSVSPARLIHSTATLAQAFGFENQQCIQETLEFIAFITETCTCHHPHQHKKKLLTGLLRAMLNILLRIDERAQRFEEYADSDNDDYDDDATQLNEDYVLVDDYVVPLSDLFE